MEIVLIITSNMAAAAKLWRTGSIKNSFDQKGPAFFRNSLEGVPEAFRGFKVRGSHCEKSIDYYKTPLATTSTHEIDMGNL